MRPIPFDPALQALPELLPPTGVPSFVAQFVQETANTSVVTNTGEIGYIRYRPTKDCVVLWSFPTPSRRPLLVSGKLFSEETGANFMARSSFQQLVEKARAATGEVACPYKYLPELRLFLQVFPLDIGLPGLLLAAASEPRICEAFAQSLALPQGEIRVAEAVPWSYKPWRRCVLRYTVEGQSRWWQYFGKVFRDDRGQPMVTRLRMVKAQLSASGVPWDIAEPAIYIPEARLLVLEAMENGVEIKALLKEALNNPGARQVLRESIARSAEGLVPFQQTVIEGLPCVTPQALLRGLGQNLKQLYRMAPALAQSSKERLRSLETVSRRLLSEALVLTHGAFRHDQFLLCSNKLVLLDLDTLCLSGASADAGNFLAYLDLTALRRRRLRPVVQECKEVFLEALQRHAGIHPGWLAWYRAAAHMKCALRSCFSLPRKWPETTEGLLSLAQETLGGDLSH